MKPRCVFTLAVGLLACTHAGVGSGELLAPGTTPGSKQDKGLVAFRWQSGSDPSSGVIEATLPDGRLFRGNYVQPRTTEWQTYYGPYWGAWAGPWGMAGPWYAGPQSSFALHYAGKALAHLKADDGTRMRCEFTLYRPDAGLEGGGEGNCQRSTNEEVFGAELATDDL